MKKIISALTAILMLVSLQVFAADLGSAKSQGLIGEQANGYLGLVTSAPADVKALVASTNSKRKAKYQQIAAKQKIPLSQVEMIAGKKAMQKTRPGNYIKPQGSGWKKK